MLYFADDVAIEGEESEEDEDEDLAGLLDGADEPIEEIIERCGVDQIKNIAQKRIDVGRILRAAAAKLGSDDSDDEEEEEEEEDEDDDSEDKNDEPSSAGETSMDSTSADAAAATVKSKPDAASVKEPLHQVTLNHLVQENNEESQPELSSRPAGKLQVCLIVFAF